MAKMVKKLSNARLGIGAPGGGTFTSAIAKAASHTLRNRTTTVTNHRPAAAASAACTKATSVYTGARRGSMAAALAAASTDEDLQTALEAQLQDRYALTSQSSRASCLRTWILFHEAVHSGLPVPPPPFPLTPDIIHRVSSLFKAGRYMSFSN